MSFVAASQRGFEPLPHTDSLNPNTRMNVPTFDTMSLQPLPASSSPSNGHQPAHTADRPSTLPKLGQTRCYWALLSPELCFLYIDPVLANHLAEQADALIGKCLMSFVHPDEQVSAKKDLGSVLESRTLHGSVTRVRYSRLSRVRKQLGYEGTDRVWPDADKVCVDENYMAVDIVINWAADGLVLCFMHAATDLYPSDNDERHKTPWTNWCGTPSMDMDQVQLLYSRLLDSAPQSVAMTRVFQILLNDLDRSLWLSWPPDQTNGDVPTSKDFALLAVDVQIGGSVASGNDAKTSCTRRYKALQNMHFGSNGSKEVESIFIPHGSIIFACHKVNNFPRGNGETPPTTIYPGGYQPQMAPQYYEQPPHSYSLPPVPAPAAPYQHYYLPPPSQHHPGSQFPPPCQNAETAGSSHYGSWTHQNPPTSSSPTVSSVRSSSYPHPPPQQHQWSSQPPYMENGDISASYQPSGLQYSTTNDGNDGASSSPGSDVVPASRINQRRGSSTRDQYGNGGRSSGNPPVGVNKCSSCKVTHSPEWRKGPSGKKDLCNACGLRYARSRAKKEGSAAARRRKERSFTNMLPKEGSPSAASPIAYNGMRRNSMYDESPFVSNSSQGSASGSEAYHQAPQGYAMTPSPSPPSGNVHFTQYTHYPQHPQNPPPPPPPGMDGRQYAPHSGNFYSMPPPMPGTSMPPHMQQQNGTRLEPIVAHGGRTPSMPSPSSPLSTSLSAASFEREKAHGRERAPAAAEGRNPPGKSSYM